MAFFGGLGDLLATAATARGDAGGAEDRPGGVDEPLPRSRLRVLAVSKVVMADRIQRIGTTRLSFRHTGQEDPSEQKTGHLGACSDTRKHIRAENGGFAETGDELWGLTCGTPSSPRRRRRGRTVGETTPAA
ncbi:hypothetical protein ACH4JS_23020 [Streptomyces sp. NPDC017638]|uniref:hypothetical protein n=1 Tax=Streptomyces sp. NPDC017638 TaxID=3365004 RepID=UPI0037A5689A